MKMYFSQHKIIELIIKAFPSTVSFISSILAIEWFCHNKNKPRVSSYYFSANFTSQVELGLHNKTDQSNETFLSNAPCFKDRAPGELAVIKQC